MTTSPRFLVLRQQGIVIMRVMMIAAAVIGRTVMLTVMLIVAGIVVGAMSPLLLLVAAVRALNPRHSKMIPRGRKFMQ